MLAILELNAPESWPLELLTVLRDNQKLLLKWERGRADVGDGRRFDAAIYRLIDILQNYALIGWHCTRLTESEMTAIRESGMQLPSAEILRKRIDKLAEQGLLAQESALLLKERNQAGDTARKGRLWFCFFPPRIAGESGINRLLGLWGGEALYNSHWRDPVVARMLGAIGVPSIVKAQVPISYFSSAVGLALKIVRRFLIHTGYKTQEPIEHEDNIVHPLSQRHIQRVIRFPSPEFSALTGHESWREPLT